MAAYLFDAAITTCGIAVDNALTERVNKSTAKEPKWEALYTLPQLLDPIFRLPVPLPPPKLATQPAQSGLAALMAMAGQSNGGVKLWGYVKPS